MNISDINFFLYRRLSRWITCRFNLFDNSKLSLTNKYEVASIQDVFFQPLYWQLFSLINQLPKLIVDCGANCGHFSILVEICIKYKFSSSNAEYLLRV